MCTKAFIETSGIKPRPFSINYSLLQLTKQKFIELVYTSKTFKLKSYRKLKLYDKGAAREI